MSQPPVKKQFLQKRGFWLALAAPLAGWFLGGFALFGFASPIPPFSIKEEKAHDYLKRGLRQFNHHQYGAARESFIQALNIYPDLNIARRFLGDAFYYNGEWEAALREWDSLFRRGYEDNILASKLEKLRLGTLPRPREEDLSFFRDLSGWQHRSYRFQAPADVLVGRDNELFILGYKSANLTRYSADGYPQAVYRGAEDRFEGPLVLDTDGELIYILDFRADTIHRLDRRGNSRPGLGKSGREPGQLSAPQGLAVRGDRLYISDTGNNRLQVWDKEGSFISQVTRADISFLDKPRGVAVGEKRIYFVNGGTNDILELDVYGNFLARYGHPELAAPRGLRLRGGELLVSDEKEGLFLFNLKDKRWRRRRIIDRRDEQVRMFRRLFAADRDRHGNLYTADYGRGSVQVFQPAALRTTNLDVGIERVATGNWPTVGVYVTVKNRAGNFLGGLNPRNFVVRENDVEIGSVNTSFLEKYQERLSLVVVMERSPEMERYAGSFRHVLRHLLDRLKKNDEIALLNAGQYVFYQTGFESSRLRLLRLMGEGAWEKERALIQSDRALFTALQTLQGRHGPRAMLYVTAGNALPNSFRQYSLQRIKERALAAQIPLFVLSLRPKEKDIVENDWLRDLKELSAATGGRLYHAFQSAELKNIYADMQKQRDRRYLLAFDSRANAGLRDQFVELAVEVQYQGINGIWNSGYFVPEEAGR